MHDVPRSLLSHYGSLLAGPNVVYDVIEGLFHVAAHTFNVVDTIYIMSHYSAGGTEPSYLVTVYQRQCVW
ncbi:hypothetical protein F2P81_021783 [Scophthalmus maximus]|uniref:Uncharacterized protein n=1 Tax=Scophthalmus maximus TaxID=52904 RepID=A0A6A4S0D7_SCOMX|nr:hypothetical protein F2P81_021783 [Scophthalmus maximus]